MNDLTPIPQKDFYVMMVGMLGNTAPPAIPQNDYQRGIIPNAIHNIRLGQMVKTSEREKIVALNQEAQTIARVNQTVVSMTSQARIFDNLRQYDHLEKMRTIERETAEGARDEGRLKNQVLYFEVKITEIEYKKQMMEFKETYGKGAEEDGPKSS